MLTSDALFGHPLYLIIKQRVTFKILQMYKLTVILMLVFWVRNSDGQNIIDKDSAISIAYKNGLEQGIDPPAATLANDIWEVKCLLCTGENSASYQAIKIYAKTGEVIENTGYTNAWLPLGWMPTDNTKIDFSNKPDSLLKKQLPYKPIRLTRLSGGDEYNPKLSPDNSKVAFQYNSDIYIVSMYDQQETKICENCNKPTWLDNDWLAYFRNNESQIFKSNINTGETFPILKLAKYYGEYALTKNNEWVAYISNEVWDLPVYEKKGFMRKKVIQLSPHINGLDRDLCLISLKTGEKKYVTKVARYVHFPIWSSTGDTLFFYMENEKYFVDDFESGTIKYSKFNGLENISLWDYKNARQGRFPYESGCKIYSINLKTLSPTSILIDKRGRYGSMVFTDNLEYLIFTETKCRDCNTELWKLKLK